MIVPVPNPKSIPENAPEHCPVTIPLYVLLILHSEILRRERSQSSQASPMPVMAAQTKQYVHQAPPKFQILHFL